MQDEVLQYGKITLKEVEEQLEKETEASQKLCKKEYRMRLNTASRTPYL